MSPKVGTQLGWGRIACHSATIVKVCSQFLSYVVAIEPDMKSSDIYSITLTAVSSLLRKYNIDRRNIGRLEVGTETLLDKFKSVKSVLMQLFSDVNTNIVGVDNINACYGGTNALFNAVDWIESSAWDGREAIVVAGDIVVYSHGAARSTGGAGAVAILVGPNAPVVVQPGLRGSFFQHAYDFYKADFRSEYPIVQGQYSMECYTRSLDACYEAYKLREQVLASSLSSNSPSPSDSGSESSFVDRTDQAEAEETGLESADLVTDRFEYMVFHSPTSGLDSQSSWAIISVLRRLADQGHTILCTIHQPSSTLFEQFDRLLFLARGGRTAYFGPIGFNSRDLLDYFESNGARTCDRSENPAEYIIEVVSENNKTSQDWPGTWNNSGLGEEVSGEVNKLMRQSSEKLKGKHSDPSENQASYESLYAMPFWTQQKLVTMRLFQQYWRTPSYVLGKATLGIFASLYVDHQSSPVF